MGIYVNQVGYVTGGKKVAAANVNGYFQLFNADTDEMIKEVFASYKGEDAASGDEIWQIDFSEVKEEGNYYILDADTGTKERSDTFRIADDVYEELQKALVKALYYQRCGCGLDEKYAGIYKHAVCHKEPAILLQDYVNHTKDPKTYELCGGWHDAGDYGRYSSAAAVALGHLLYAFELFPQSFEAELNIPESGNGTPDVLNECRYELDWLIRMQDEEGGVYHKLTAFSHADFLMPEEDLDQLLIFPVSSIATADYAAVMALASRVYRLFDPEFADRALKAARKSFEWLTKHDYIGFHNPEGSNTGEYDDECDMDERMWAAAELLRSDPEGDTESYRKMLEQYVFSEIGKTDMGWTDVGGFTLLALLTDPDEVAGEKVTDVLKKAMYEECDRLLEIREGSGYLLAMKPDEFVWGSNMVVCNRGILFILAAYLADPEQGYTTEEKMALYDMAAYDQLHYLLGRNALNRSYVTGFGEHAYRNPHNRPTAMDGIDDPMPGWVSGGPFKTPCDEDAMKLIPAGTPPMKCHADVAGSYSTNEITIYWNSPAAFMTAYFNR